MRKVWTRLAAVALGAAIAVAALTAASAQQEPPFRFYGYGNAGDEVGVTGGDGVALSATAGEDGGWYIDVASGAQDGAEWTLNGERANATLTNASSSQAQVTLEPAPVAHEDGMLDEGMEDDGMMEDDDSMMEDGGMLEDESGDDTPPVMEEDDSMMEEDDSMMEDDDSMMEDDDGMMDDGMMDEDDGMMHDDDGMMDDGHDDGMMDGDEGEDVGMPATGTGGIAEGSGLSAGLIGLLVALGAAAIAGIGFRRFQRVRNRA